jgi:hypothetical protein
MPGGQFDGCRKDLCSTQSLAAILQKRIVDVAAWRVTDQNASLAAMQPDYHVTDERLDGVDGFRDIMEPHLLTPTAMWRRRIGPAKAVKARWRTLSRYVGNRSGFACVFRRLRRSPRRAELAGPPCN